MRGIDMLCTSQAATAIRLSTTTIMDDYQQPSSSSSSPSSSSTAHLITSTGGGGGGGRAIDRHNPIIRDARRIGKSLPLPPCTSQPPPISPIPYKKSRNRKSSSSTSTSTSKENIDQSKKYCSSSSSTKKTKKSASNNNNNNNNKDKPINGEVGDVVVRKSCAIKAGDFISPAASSRYLLSDPAFLDVLSDFDPVLALVPPPDPTKSQPLKPPDDSSASNSNPSSSSSRSPHQVVVLRVSLHCKGCEGKVRKHISRMQGVTSFNIDFAAKKVTVVGDVTPLGVLASISKVKSAQLWTPPISSSSSAAAPAPAPAASSFSTHSSEIIKKNKGVVAM